MRLVNQSVIAWGIAWVLTLGCDASNRAPGADGGTSDSQNGEDGSGGGPLLADQYPGDLGLEEDPAVIWVENFEAESIDAIISRYDDHKNPGGMSLDSDVPESSAGSQSMLMRAGAGVEATDLYKSFSPGYDEWYVRWYVKYEPTSTYHHSGVWFGGYNPPSSWPNPGAGNKPSGDDLFSIAIEPNLDGGGDAPRLDFYNYWMQMHTYEPGASYWGNSLVQNSKTEYDDGWMCIEVHVRLNSEMDSSDGAELALWIDEENVATFSDTEGLGYWVADRFCPKSADLPGCLDYPPAEGEAMGPLDLQFRTVEALQLNYFWPENYVSQENEAPLWYDDMVIATERIGCVK